MSSFFQQAMTAFALRCLDPGPRCASATESWWIGVLRWIRGFICHRIHREARIHRDIFRMMEIVSERAMPVGHGILGKVTSTVRPPSGRAVAVRVALCAVAMARTMARPRP